MSRRFLSLFLSILFVSGVMAGVLVPSLPAAAAQPVWFLAEGSTAWGFDTTICIQNPNTTGSPNFYAKVTYMGNSGVITTIWYFLYPTSQTRINVRDAIGEKDFSAKVECTDASKTIAVDRTMYWMGGPGSEGDKNMEIHSSIGVTGPSTTWFLPEGSSAWGFETWLTIQNPNPFNANCHITYMIEGGVPTYKDKVLPANSRGTYSMAQDIGSNDASIRVETLPGQPVIAERTMYKNSRRLGTESVGATQPAPVFLLAEGTTAWGFTTYLIVENPNGASANIAVWWLTPGGPVGFPAFSMPALSRKTIRVNDYLPNSDCSIYVQGLGGANIVAERAMYWGGNTVFGEAAHDSIGVAGSHKTWYLPDGGCQDLQETWTTVQNPNGSPVDIQVTYMGVGSTTPISFGDTLPAWSRKSYNIEDTVAPGSYATRVFSTTPGNNIVVERSMYYDTQAYGGTFHTAGSNTIGAWED